AFLGDGDVAHYLQHIASAHCVAIDAGDHGLLQFADGFVHFHRGHDALEHEVVRQAALAAAEAEDPVACTCDDDDPSARLTADLIDAIANLKCHGRREHIAVFGPVQRNGANGAV